MSRCSFLSTCSESIAPRQTKWQFKWGLQVVNETLANNYIRPDESMKAQSRVKEKGKYTFIDKVKVRLVDSQYWASAVNFGNEWIHIPDNYVRDYERLLTGGIWAQIDMRFEYDDENKGKNPFWIDRLTPIQLATFDLEEYRRLAGRVQLGRVARCGDAEHGVRARAAISQAEAPVRGAPDSPRPNGTTIWLNWAPEGQARAMWYRRSHPTRRC